MSAACNCRARFPIRSPEARQTLGYQYPVIRTRPRRTPSDAVLANRCGLTFFPPLRGVRVKPSGFSAAVPQTDSSAPTQGARPLNDLDHRALGHPFGQHARERAERSGFDPGITKQLQHEACFAAQSVGLLL